MIYIVKGISKLQTCILRNYILNTLEVYMYLVKRLALIITAILINLNISSANAGGMVHEGHNIVYPYAVFSGVDYLKGSIEAYSGGMMALNGNLDNDGFILRVLGTIGKYEYDNSGTDTDGETLQGDIMLGYQIVRKGRSLAAYIGADFQDHDLSPDDTTNKLRGSLSGLKVAVDYGIERYTDSPYHLAIRGSYSTAFDTYYALGRVGLNYNSMAIGPEVMLLGDKSGDGQRVGAYILFDFELDEKYPGTVSFSAGYQFINNSDSSTGHNFGDEGGYFTAKYTMALGEDG